MAEYKDIKGFNIQYLDSDPPNPIIGQIWFNSTSQTLKGAEAGGAPAGTWASGGSLNLAQVGNFGFGTQTAAISAGGQYPLPYSSQTESYNGSSWTIVSGMPTTRYAGGATGTSTAGLVFGNELGTAPRGSTISWNGTSWAVEPATLATPRGTLGGCGTQTAALAVSGNVPPLSGATESYNGTSWTELTDLNTARYGIGLFGDQTTATAAGGASPVFSAAEVWNGTSWTNVNSLNTARKPGSSKDGSYTSGIVFGGNPITAATESWDGTSWTEVNDMSTARYDYAGTGSVNSAIAAGGSTPTQSTATEEWTVPDVLINTLTTS